MEQAAVVRSIASTGLSALLPAAEVSAAVIRSVAMRADILSVVSRVDTRSVVSRVDTRSVASRVVIRLAVFPVASTEVGEVAGKNQAKLA